MSPHEPKEILAIRSVSDITGQSTYSHPSIEAGKAKIDLCCPRGSGRISGTVWLAIWNFQDSCAIVLAGGCFQFGVLGTVILSIQVMPLPGMVVVHNVQQQNRNSAAIIIIS